MGQTAVSTSDSHATNTRAAQLQRLKALEAKHNKLDKDLTVMASGVQDPERQLPYQEMKKEKLLVRDQIKRLRDELGLPSLA